MKRIRRNTSLAAIILATSALAYGCGAGSVANTPPPINNSKPSLASLSPTSVIVGGSSFTLTVNGSNFTSATIVQWNGQSVPTTFVSSQQVTAAIPPSLITSGGTDSVSAENGSSAQSNALQFAVNYPALQITSISPTSVTAGAATFLVTINGSGFVSSISGVLFNGVGQPTTWLSATQLQATIPASAVTAPGAVQVLVEDSTFDSNQPLAPLSNAATFTVTPLTSNPVPTLNSSSDASVPAGWPGFELTVNGTNFVDASVLQWNGVDRPTMVTSSTQLRAAIPSDQMVSPGAAQISVFNPSPGGGSSGTLPITVQAVPPDAIGVIDRSNIRNDLFEPDLGGDSAKVSSDGRFVVFRSSATDQAPSASDFSTDVFLRDTCIGGPTGCVPSVTSLPLASDSIAISANGRFVGAMINDPDPNVDLSLYDTCFGAPAGCVPAARAINAVPDMFKLGLSLSADGRFAVFLSGQPGCTDGECDLAQIQVFLTDTCAGISSGCTPSFRAISPVSTGMSNPIISPDGRFVTFNSSVQDVSVIDTCQDGPAGCAPSTTLVSVASDGGTADAESLGGSSSNGGRYVTFLSRATNLVSGGLSSGVTRVYVRDMCTGAPSGCTPETTLVADAGDDTFLDSPSISADGRYIAFSSDVSDLVPGDTNGVQDIFVRDTCAGVSSGCTASTVRVSIALDGTQGTDFSFTPTISADGRFVAFCSFAKLAPGILQSETPNIYLARH